MHSLITFTGLIIWCIVLTLNVYGLIVCTHSLTKLLKKCHFPTWLNSFTTFFIMGVLSVICAAAHVFWLFDYYIYYFTPVLSVK